MAQLPRLPEIKNMQDLFAFFPLFPNINWRKSFFDLCGIIVDPATLLKLFICTGAMYLFEYVLYTCGYIPVRIVKGFIKMAGGLLIHGVTITKDFCRPIAYPLWMQVLKIPELFTKFRSRPAIDYEGHNDGKLYENDDKEQDAVVQAQRMHEREKIDQEMRDLFKEMGFD
jgi:hypothetical protein